MSEWKGKELSHMSEAEAKITCDEIRNALITTVSKTGGHLGSNLGAVELTVALHRVFDFDVDRLVFDVGHQCYAHKMLTGRADKMATLRKFGGLSGFPKPYESKTDAFIAGHASNSVSVALGMARARTRMHQDYKVVALIGDGALTGGLAYEGLSDAGSSGENLLVILNDNGMSIRKNVGGISKLLERQHLSPAYLRFKRGYGRFLHAIPFGEKIYNLLHKIKKVIKGSILPSTFFENMGFDYVGPVDGNDVVELTRLLRWSDTLKGPVLFHVQTKKGKGYAQAEQHPEYYHGVSSFDIQEGVVPSEGHDFSAAFGQSLVNFARNNERVCAITAAMQSGTGLDAFAAQFPNRFFDVGIAEGHAVAMAAGMAKQGMIPVFAVYSSFLQRSYDMLLHDVALQKLHVVIGVDRAGLVGADGATHHGVFDLAFLSTIPGMTVLAPSNYMELDHMLEYAIEECDGPVAIRYPRGNEPKNCIWDKQSFGDRVVRTGDAFTLVSYGDMLSEVISAADLLCEQGIYCEVIKIDKVVPLCSDLIVDSLKKTGRLLVLEDVISRNSLGRALMMDLVNRGVSLKNMILLNSGDDFVTHGSVGELRKMLGIDAEAVVSRIKEALG